jgi:hypothetical protein
MHKRICFVLAVATAGATAAAEPRRPDPRDPKAKAPPVEYRSAFEAYRSYAEPELAPWRAVNDEVRKAGGHLGIVRASKPDSRGGHK